MKLQNIKRIFSTGGFIAGIAGLFLAALVFISPGNNTASAADFSANAIMKGGASSPSDFISKVRSGNGGTQRDLASIYAAYGLTSADYNRFVSSAQPGTAFKNGTIVVNGRMVATNSKSIGRSKKAHSTPKMIAGTTYWEDTAQNVFLSNSIPVWVLFNAQGAMQFAVMGNCGNPTNGQNVTPESSCNSLNVRNINRNTFAFTTSVTASNGATIDHVMYDFGDGTTMNKTNPAEEVTHTYSIDGSIVAKVTVFVKLPGVSALHVIAPAGNCQKVVRVVPLPKPPTPPVSAPSVNIQKDVDGVKQEQVNVGQNFVYHVTVNNGGNTDLKNVAVTDTPPSGVSLLSADVGTIEQAANTWSFTIPNLVSGDSVTFSITAVVPAFMPGSLVNKACVNAPGVPNQPTCDTATVTVTPPPAAPVSTPPTVQPQVLPNTGAGNVIGIFAGVVATGFVTFRFFLGFRQILGRQ